MNILCEYKIDIEILEKETRITENRTYRKVSEPRHKNIKRKVNVAHRFCFVFTLSVFFQCLKFTG